MELITHINRMQGMARPLRLEFPGAFYHVMSRGNDKREVFQDASDYRFFLWLLETVCRRFAFLCHAYALMPNHYHLILETPQEGLSRGLHFINGLYGQYFNNRYERVGHLFQGRFKSLLVDRESYLLTLNRYIHQNPVKAGLARKTWDYPWSSCRAFLGLERPPAWLETRATLARFGAPDQRVQEYLKFLEARREPSPWKACAGQALLGSPEFVAAMKEKVSTAVRGQAECAHRLTLKSRVSPQAIVAMVHTHFPNNRDWKGGQGRPPSAARDAAIALQRKWCGLMIRELGASHQLSNAGVSLALSRYCARLREDAAFRKQIAAIDLALSKAESEK